MKCEITNCKNSATFQGFNKKLCWHHYSEWLLQFKFTPPDLFIDTTQQLTLPLEFEEI